MSRMMSSVANNKIKPPSEAINKQLGRFARQTIKHLLRRWMQA